MGVVYRARDPRLKRDVALKVLPPGLTRDAGRLRRFEQESLAAAALNHPNVVSVFDVGLDDSGPYVVSELLEGETLGTVLARGRASATERRRCSPRRRPAAWRPRTRPASCIAISSPRTSSSPPTGG